MKIFTNKNITQKIILAIVIVTLCNFIFPTYSRAGFFGMLFDPIFDLLVGIGDSVVSVLQACLYDGNINFVSGLLNVVGGANYIKVFQERYPDMTYTGPTITSSTSQDDLDEMNANGEIVLINETEFGTVSLYDIAGLIAGGPVAIFSGINIAGKLLGITKNYNVPTIQYSVDKIFSGKVPAFDINFINPKYRGDFTDVDGDGKDDRTGDTESIYNNKKDKSIASSIQSTVATWYNALRNLAIVALLSILVYIGIRIIISSSADDRAKYKQRLMDWVVAMCLLFCMHYIMAFIVIITEIISSTLGEAMTSIPVVIAERGLASYIGDGVITFNTDLLGLTRLQVQYEDLGRKLIYLILYIALIVYTVKYSWRYMKRTITIMFLTIIAPLVAMTYPIDKMNDGKAQAFNAWIKEYIFTALLQPFHLIIYSVLMGSALKIVITNPIYAIMVLAFMEPAEKMLRKFFGFDKASTPGMLSQAGAMFGGAAAMNLVKKGAGHFIDKKAGGSGKGEKGVRTKGGSGVEDKNAPSSIGDLVGNVTDQNGKSSIIENVLGGEPESKVGKLAVAGLKAGETAVKGGVELVKNAAQPVGNAAAKVGEVAKGAADKAKNMVPEGAKSEFARMRSDIAKTSLGRKAAETGKRYTNIRNASKEKLREWANKNVNLKDPRVRKKLGKKALKLAGRTAVAGTMGAIGLGMGIAGDDLEDVLKYGAGGAALGYATAPGIGNKIANSGIGQAISQGYGREVYGSDNAAEVEREKQRLFESGEMREEAESYYDDNGNHYTGDELNELEQRLIEHEMAGLSSASDRKKAIKVEDKIRKELYKNLPPPDDENYEQELQKQNDIAKAKAQVATKVASTIESKKLNTTKGQEEISNLFKTELINKGVEKESAGKEADQMLGYVLSIHKKPKM